MIYKFRESFAFKVSGKDAIRYVTARITNDINLLDKQNVIKSAILNAQGKTKGYFSIIKDNDSFIFTSENGNKEEIIKSFKQFLVADQVVVEELNLKLIHTEEENLVQNYKYKFKSNRLNKDAYEYLCTLENEESLTKVEEFESGEFNFLRVKANNLTFNELEEIFFPEAELKNAYSSNKGCYCGQEAVEMVLARGKLPAIIKVGVIKGKVLKKDLESDKIFKDSNKEVVVGSILKEFYYSKKNDSSIFFLRLRKERELRNFYLDSNKKDVILEIL